MEDVVRALRRAREDLDREYARANETYLAATQALEDVARRRAEFDRQISSIASAAGFAVTDVTEAAETEGTRPPHLQVQGRRKSAEMLISLPTQPESLRWYAGQALHQLGDEASILEVAAKMKSMGFQHKWDPARERQLEASLAALPSQVGWIVRGDGRSRLRLELNHK